MFYGRVFTDEMIQFIRDNAAGTRIKVLTAMLNERFGTNLSYNQVYVAMKNRKIKTGVDTKFYPGCPGTTKGMKFPGRKSSTSFYPGRVPPTIKPIGSETIRHEGYYWIKVANPNVWREKHRHIWEQAHGPIPKTHVVLFADGNKLNCTLENLILIKRSQLVRMNQNHLIQNEKELTESGIVVADLLATIDKKKREVKRGGNNRTGRPPGSRNRKKEDPEQP